MWEVICKHAQCHLTQQDASANGDHKLQSTQVKDFLQDSWLNSAPTSKCITIGELLEYTRLGHSHTENAKCLRYHQTLDGLVDQGLKPAVNSESYLIARLTTKPGVCHQDKDAKKRTHVMSTQESLQLQDDTGSVQCQVSFCNWDWLDQVLMVPCWNFIPGADERVPGQVEICPHCTPVAITRRTPGPSGVPSSSPTMSVATAAKLLDNHDSSKGRLDQISVTGRVVNKSPIIRVHGKPLFFFKMVSDISGKESISLLAKGKHIIFLYSAVCLNASCSVNHLTPTNILKGTRHSYRVFLCRRESTVVDVTRSFDHPNGLRGTVTKVIDASSGIYELDDKIRLYLCYQMDDSASHQALRVGCNVVIHHAHRHLQTNKSKLPHIVCCTRSTLSIHTFSPLDTGVRKMSSPSLSGMVRLLLKMNLTVSCLDWLSVFMSQLEKKFSPTFVRRKDLHTILFRLFSTASVLSQKPLLSGRKRNIYEEFLNPSHTCLATKQMADHQSTAWQFPDMAELSACCGRPEGLHRPLETGNCGDSGDGSSFLGTSDWQCRVTRSNELKPPMILLGYLHLSPTTGMLQLRDQTGFVDCIITDTRRQPQTGSHTDAVMHPTPDSDARTPADCCPTREAVSDGARSKERRCSLPRCHHMHTWCLGHLIRVEGFLFIQEALPLSRVGSPPGPVAETGHRGDADGEDWFSMGGRQYAAFSMQSVECLTCTSLANSVQATSGLAAESQEARTQERTQTDTSLKRPNSNHPKEGLCLPKVNPESAGSKTSEEPAFETPNLESSKVGLFLVLTKSGLMGNPGDSLFFVTQVVTLHEDGPTATSGDPAANKEWEMKSRRALVRFGGEAVRWYNTLHCGCAYRMKGKTTTVSEAEFFREMPSSEQLTLEDCSLFVTVSADTALEQIHENMLPAHAIQTLHRGKSQFRGVLHVTSVQDILAIQPTHTDLCVSFHCIVISRQQTSEDQPCHLDEKRKRSPHRQTSQSASSSGLAHGPGDEIQLLVADSTDRSVTLHVYMSRSSLQSVVGLLPGARATFRRCKRYIANGLVCCCVTPLSSVTVDGISPDTTSLQNLQDGGRRMSPTDVQTNTPTDPPTGMPKVPLTDTPIALPTDQPPMGHSADCTPPSFPSLAPPRRIYLSHLLASPDLVSPAEVFTIHCHLQAIKSLILKWSCSLCGHKDCVCSSDAGKPTGELTATARFAVEDGSGEALVWCSEQTAIAAVLGLTGYQWNQLQLAVRNCKEVSYTYKKSDFNQAFERPSSSDTEGQLSLLCSHGSVQKPLVLRCCRMVWGNGKHDTAPHAGESKREFAPSVYLKCMAAQPGLV